MAAMAPRECPPGVWPGVWDALRAEFGPAVANGLDRHWPELTADARRVLAGDYSYSHAT